MDVNLSYILTRDPKMHPDCCVAISQPFLASLLNLFPSYPALVVSVGSGTGFLEACLIHLAGDSLNLLGLEVSASVNKYLPEQNFAHVPGTWSLYDGAASAEVLLFVYPREPRLMARYLQYVSQTSCRKVIWIGPAQDWPDYEAVLSLSDFSDINIPAVCGTAGYEMVSVAIRSAGLV